MHSKQKNTPSFVIEQIEINPQKVNKQSKIDNQPLEKERYHFREQLKNEKNGKKVGNHSNLLMFQPKPIYLQTKPKLEYNFKPIQDKTTFTKADDTLYAKNKALYHTNFRPKSHHLYSLHKPVKNLYRKPKCLLHHKKYGKNYFHLTRRTDGFYPNIKENTIKI
jgi:hypothetical protein